MADPSNLGYALTDPRMALANQLMQQGADSTPVRSWAQELARALQGAVGGYYGNKFRTDQTNAISGFGDKVFGVPEGAPQPASNGPGLLGRVFGGSAPHASPQAAPASPNAPDAPQGQSAGIPQPPPPGTPVAQQLNYAKQLYYAGRSLNTPFGASLMQQALTMRQSLIENEAKAQIETTGVLARQGMKPDLETGAISGIPGYQDVAEGNKIAETRGGELGKTDPSVTKARIAQTNAENTGTSASNAAKAGAATHATALASNAPDVATLEASKASGVSQAQAKVAAETQPALEAAKAEAVNKVNAGRPLTPEQVNAQEQRLSHDFMETKTVKDHYEATQAYKNVIQAAQGKDKASDINLIDALVKMFNPGATVRQSTFENFMEHAQGVPDNIIGVVKGVMSGAHLQPETRAQLLAQATSRMDSSRQVYNSVADFARDQATKQGLNPQNVVPTLLDPLTATEIARARGFVQDPATGKWGPPPSVKQ